MTQVEVTQDSTALDHLWDGLAALNDVQHPAWAALTHVKNRLTAEQANAAEIAERDALIEGVKEAVHSKALDRLGNAMAKLEYDYSGRFSVWREVGQINDTLAHYEVTRPPRGDEEGPQPLRMIDPTANDQFKIGGEVWTEARNHWRQEVARLFPAQGGATEGGDCEAGSVSEANSTRSAKPMRPDTPSSIPVDQPTRSGALGQRVEED